MLCVCVVGFGTECKRLEFASNVAPSSSSSFVVVVFINLLLSSSGKRNGVVIWLSFSVLANVVNRLWFSTLVGNVSERGCDDSAEMEFFRPRRTVRILAGRLSVAAMAGFQFSVA
ncbi:hypothetical protein MLD38_013200 [Melastoma candidum]|uniref:Uncharacterized protein n=1 Tax=Melastoma candidum TaxID=119954 RepID=A0ACB9R873_9MYRT|nr:hypothetical protein MLD38_013200 [Melastoma candidum]